MEDDDWCELLKVQAVPHIFLAGDSSSTLQIEEIIPDILKDNIPIKLTNQLEKLALLLAKAEEVHYKTIFHSGRSLINENSSFVRFELMPQPYVFYNVSEDRHEHKSNLKYAIYTLDSKISQLNIRELDGNIKINPNNIMENDIATKIDCSQCSLHSDTQFEISTFLPVQVFFTLTLVPYEEGFPRALICKNVVVFNDENELGKNVNRITHAGSFLEKIDPQSLVWTILNNSNPRIADHYETEGISNLAITLMNSQNDNAKEFWVNRLYYFIWHFSGRPDVSEFGKEEFDRLCQKSYEPQGLKRRWNAATEFLNRCYGALIQEMFDWVKEI